MKPRGVSVGPDLAEGRHGALFAEVAAGPYHVEGIDRPQPDIVKQHGLADRCQLGLFGRLQQRAEVVAGQAGQRRIARRPASTLVKPASIGTRSMWLVSARQVRPPGCWG